MRLLDKYLIYSSILALFSEHFYYHYIIDWKLFYLILISNIFIFGFKYKYQISKNIVYILLFFLIHGCITYLLFQNPIKSLFVQLIGIALSSLYYYNFIQKYGTNKLFKLYSEIAFYVALLAIPMFYLGINIFTKYRLNGIMSEPAHFAAIMLPALYFFLKNKKFLKFLVIITTIFLSKSSIGYIGLILMVLIPLFKIKNFLKYALGAFVILLLTGLFLNSKWNEKIDENESNTFIRRLKQTKETLSATIDGKFKNYTNLSTYAFLSNAFITKEIFIHKPIGAGLGSYPYEYDKYYEKLSPPEYLLTLKQSKINRTDANSLFLRMLADLGIFAVLILIYFIYRSIKVFSSENKDNQQSTFFYLITKLIREGHYFPPEFYFFLFIFLKNSNENSTHS